MATELPKDQETASRPLVGVSPEQPKVRRAVSKARRELTEEELAAPAARVMLLDEVDRLDSENTELSQFRNRFHQVDKECAVLKEREKGGIASDIVFTVSMTLGGVVVGALPGLSSVAPKYHDMALAVGILLMLTGIVAKGIRIPWATIIKRR